MESISASPRVLIDKDIRTILALPEEVHHMAFVRNIVEQVQPL
jgi:hypothetical protein